ncbi:hypothetical protein GCM10009624_14750 [Gordonia sinesedis]
MRSYNQYCSMARALDLVGDRWTLLIVRELLTQNACRFSDLRRGLPGIASNLLADRLRDMDAAGIVERTQEPPPVAATLIRLTDRGQDLAGVVRELTRWGAPLMFDPASESGAAAEDAPAFRMHWFLLPLRYLARDNTPDEPPVVVRFGDVYDGCDVTIGVGDGADDQNRNDDQNRTDDGRGNNGSGQVAVAPSSSGVQPDTTVTGPGPAVVRMVTGLISVADAPGHGITIDGNPRSIERLLPGGMP